MELSQRLLKIAQQIGAVVDRFKPTCVGIETVWFGQNITAAFSTGQARGAALVACAQGGLMVGEFTPRQIKLAVVGEGTAEKDQVQYMVKQILGLDDVPHPDHAADALAAAICYVTHGPTGAVFGLACCRGRLGIGGAFGGPTACCVFAVGRARRLAWVDDSAERRFVLRARFIGSYPTHIGCCVFIRVRERAVHERAAFGIPEMFHLQKGQEVA